MISAQNELKNIASCLRKIIVCSICEDTLEDPIRTPCRHYFCNNCIIRALGKKKDRECPLCDGKIAKRTLRPSYLLSRVISVSKGITDTIDGFVGATENEETIFDRKLPEDHNTLRSPVFNRKTPKKLTPLAQRNYNPTIITPTRGTLTISRLDQENRRKVKRRLTNFDQNRNLNSINKDESSSGENDKSSRNRWLKKQKPTRLLPELNRQQDSSSAAISEDTDDPYTFIASQKISTPKKKRPGKRSNTKTQSDSKRMKLLPQKRTEVFDTLLLSSSNSEEEEPSPYALFLTPQRTSFKDYSRETGKKSNQKGKSEIPIFFTSTSTSTRKRKRPTSEPTRGVRKKVIAKKTPKSRAKSLPKTNARQKKMAVDDEESITEKIPRTRRANIGLFNTMPIDEVLSEKRSSCDAEHDVVKEFDKQTPKALKVVVEKLNCDVPTINTNISRSSSRCELFPECDQLENMADKENGENCDVDVGVICENESRTDENIPNNFDTEFNVEAEVRLTQKPEEGYDLNNDVVINMMYCPTQEYVDISDSGMEIPLDDSAIPLIEEVGNHVIPEASEKEHKCVNCGKPSNIVVKKNVCDASFQVDIEEKRRPLPELVSIACQTDFEDKREICENINSVPSWISQKPTTILDELDENAQSGDAIDLSMSKNDSTNSSSANSKTNEDRSLSFSHHFKPTEVVENEEAESSKKDVDKLTDVEPDGLFSQTQAMSDDEVFAKDDDDMFITRNPEERCSPELEDDSLSQIMIGPRVNINRINSSPESTRTSMDQVLEKQTDPGPSTSKENVEQKSQDEDFVESIVINKRTKRGLGNSDNQQIELQLLEKEVEIISAAVVGPPVNKIQDGVDVVVVPAKRTRRGLANLTWKEGDQKNVEEKEETLQSSLTSKNEISKDFDEHVKKNVMLQKSAESEKCCSTPINRVLGVEMISKQTRRALANSLTGEESEKPNFEKVTLIDENSHNSQDIVPPTPPNLSSNISIRNRKTNNTDDKWGSVPIVMEIEEPEHCKMDRFLTELVQDCAHPVKAKKCLSNVFECPINVDAKNVLVVDNSVLRVDDDVDAIIKLQSQEDISGVLANVEADLTFIAANDKSSSDLSKKFSQVAEVVKKSDVESQRVNYDGGDNQRSSSSSQKKNTVPETKSVRSQEKSSADVDLSQQLYLVASSLSLPELRQLSTFATKIEAEYQNTFNRHTTHVIIKAGSDRLCDRTLKYFQGIAARAWVVSFKWVTDSLRTGSILPEEDFEIVGDYILGVHHGPRKSRTSGVKLLQEYEICCVGDFQQITRENIVDLAEECGAISVLEPSMFTYRLNMTLIIVQSFRDRKKIQEMCTKFRVRATTRDWLLDSMARHECLPFDDYECLHPKTQ